MFERVKLSALLIIVPGMLLAGSLAIADEAAPDTPGELHTLYVPESRWIDLDSIAFSGDDSRLGALIRERGFLARALNDNDEATLKVFAIPPDGKTNQRTFADETGTSSLLHLPLAKSHRFVAQDDLLLVSGFPSGYRFKSGKKQIVLKEGLSGNELASFTYHSNGMSVEAAALSPEQDAIALALDWLQEEDPPFPERSVIEVLSLPEGKQRFQSTSADYSYSCVAFSPDGKYVAAASGKTVPGTFVPTAPESYRDKYLGKISLWDVATGELPRELEFDFNPYSLAFSANGEVIAVGGYDGVYDGGTNLHWWDVSTGNLLGSVDLDRPERQPKERLGETLVKSLAFAPNGKFLAAGIGSSNRGGGWGSVRLISTDNQINPVQHVLLEKHPAMVLQVIFSRDGEWLAARTRDDRLFLWNVSQLIVEPSTP